MAKEMDVDVLIFGHIHKPLIEKSDVLLVCPGSPTAPRLSEPGAVELVIQDGEITGRVIAFEGARCSSIESMKEFHAESLKSRIY
jgi:predicted phosphodiesterase